MADRQDIDALLIGALYGELDGDERARLEAHLASHPQDRSALEGLRSTRELLREADLPVAMAVEEPSPAITAMLLQEAARRAPAAKGASGGGILAFLAGLLKPFAASPALSAAAALVLVGGAAGLLYSRGALKTTEPTYRDNHAAEVDKLETNQVAAGSGAASATAAAAPTPTTPAATGAVDDYRVALADGENSATVTAENEREALLRKNAESAGGDTLAAKGKRSGGATGSTTAGAGGGGGSIAAGFESAAPTTTAKLDSAPRPGYIAIDKQAKDEPSVLALDGNRYESAPAASSSADEDQAAPAGRTQAAKKAPARVALAEGRGSAAAPAEPSPAPPPPPAAGAPAPQKPIAGKAPVQKIAQQTQTRDAGKTGSKAYDPVKTAQLDAWAREQHARMVKLINAGKCTEAGPIGAEIARKNAEYYQANVANDRAVRACRSYIDRARRAKSDDAKTKAAAPRNNAPDSPYQADMESSK